MSEQPVQKHQGPIDKIKELSGVYGLGFEKESFMGLSLPFAIVIGVGGIGAILIMKWLS
jgi:hypothetical protein